MPAAAHWTLTLPGASVGWRLCRATQLHHRSRVAALCQRLLCSRSTSGVMLMAMTTPQGCCCSHETIMLNGRQHIAWLVLQVMPWARHLTTASSGRNKFLSTHLHMQDSMLAVLSEDLGTVVDGALLGGRFELMQQRLRISGREITLVVPRDVDAVMQMYIDAGAVGPSTSIHLWTAIANGTWRRRVCGMSSMPSVYAVVAR